jgi:hypothetical protein
MSVFRPPEGFEVYIPEPVQKLLDARSAISQAHARHVTDMLDNLKMTGHQDGTLLPQRGPNVWMLKVIGTPKLGISNVRLIYQIIGKRLTIKMIG